MSSSDTSAPGQLIAVRFAGVSKRYGETTALHPTDLVVRNGELLTLLGPSGCGKTTLLNLTAGFFPPDSGTIEIDGTAVNDLPTYCRDTGVMFQSFALFPHMSVGANVGYGLRMRGVSRAEIDRRVAEILALVHMAGMEERRPNQLSGGQQQRVALARALVIQPKVLLLDEPFSALDKSLRASMQVEIKEIQKKLGVTTIFVTHDQGEALSLSDRLAVMSQGRIRQIGTPEEVYHHPADRFVASFLGDVNVLEAKVQRMEGSGATVIVGTISVDLDGSSLQGATVGEMVDLFVRPEHLRLAAAEEPAAVEGIVATHIYQGDHVDLYLDAPGVARESILIRLPGRDALQHWPAGSAIRLAVLAGNAVAFRKGA